ncbi:hypothetical protein ACOME3_010473 [Neoechinorhynchus agilis]
MLHLHYISPVCEHFSLENTLTSKQNTYEYLRLPEGGIPRGVQECGDACKCPGHCPNTLVSQGIRAYLEVFVHRTKRLGVRVNHDLPKGYFVCQLDSDKERNGNVAPITNVSHLFHRSQSNANLLIQKVHFKSNGTDRQAMALFTVRDLLAGEQLTVPAVLRNKY